MFSNKWPTRAGSSFEDAAIREAVKKMTFEKVRGARSGAVMAKRGEIIDSLRASKKLSEMRGVFKQSFIILLQMPSRAPVWPSDSFLNATSKCSVRAELNRASWLALSHYLATEW